MKGCQEQWSILGFTQKNADKSADCEGCSVLAFWRFEDMEI